MPQNETIDFRKAFKIGLIIVFWGIASVAQPGMSVIQTGGVSGGGANAVGKVLFDFYENAQTEKIPIQNPQEWRESLGNILLKLEQEIPYVAGKSLKEQLILVSDQKRWLLEPKQLKQDGVCLNSSRIKADQIVVACQTKRYVRISMDWFVNSDEKTANATILHEMYLAFVMSLSENLKLDDETRDEIVRDLTRASFAQDYDEIIKILKNDLRLKVLNRAQLQALQSERVAIVQAQDYLKKTEAIRQEQFCDGQQIDLTLDEKAAYNLVDSKFYNLLQKYGLREKNIRGERVTEVENFCLISDVKSKRYVSDSNFIPPSCIEKIPQMARELLRVAETRIQMARITVSISAIECLQAASNEANYRAIFSKRYPYSEAIRNIELKVIESPELQSILDRLEKD